MATSIGARKTTVSMSLSINLLFRVGKVHEKEPDRSLSSVVEGLIEEALKAREARKVA